MANSPAQQSAYDLIKQTLANWGLSSLYGTAVSFLKQGFTSDQVQIELENTKQYKQRFSGNELRVKAGLDTLSPAQYIAMEDSYRQVAKQFGLTPKFYAHDTLAELIGGDVSAQEYQQRAQIASQTFNQAPPEMKQFWQQYGLTAGDAVSAIMDPTKDSLADLQMKANAVQIGGTALQNHLQVSGQRAMQLAENGVTLQQAQNAYEQISAYGGQISQMAKRFGTTIDQNDMENAMLLNQGAALQKQNTVFAEEGAQFSGRGGNSVNSSNAGANY